MSLPTMDDEQLQLTKRLKKIADLHLIGVISDAEASNARNAAIEGFATSDVSKVHTAPGGGTGGTGGTAVGASGGSGGGIEKDVSGEPAGTRVAVAKGGRIIGGQSGVVKSRFESYNPPMRFKDFDDARFWRNGLPFK